MNPIAAGALVGLFGITAALGAGLAVARIVRTRTATAAGAFSFYLSMGTGILGTAFYWLGMLGSLTPAAITTVLACGLLAGAIALATTRDGLRLTRSHTSAGQTAGWVAFAVIFAAALPRALGPETEGDALCYHIEIPKQFLRLGGLEYLPWTDQSLFPLLSDLWYAVPIAFGCVVGARLFAFAWGIGLALAAAELATLLGYRRFAALAALITCSAPIVTNHATVAYNDLPVALFGTWGLIWLVRWRRTFSPRAAVLAGMALGFGAASKLTGLAWATCALGAAAVLGSRSPSRHFWRLFPAVLLLVLFAGPWYARAWYHTGNPFHPYFDRLFPGAAPVYDWRPEKPLPVTGLAALAVPLLATLYPERFGGSGQQWGAIFVAFLPAVILMTTRSRQTRIALLAAATYSVLWVTLKQNLRFLLPVLPVATVWSVHGIGYVLGTRKRLLRGAVVLVLAVQLLSGIAAPIRRSIPYAGLVTGRERVEQFLSRWEPTYEVARWVSAQVPSTGLILTQEHRLFYFDRVLIREDALRRWLGYERSRQRLLKMFAHLGFTHLLLVRSFNSEVAAYDQSLRERLGDAVDRCALIGTIAYTGPRGDRRVYELYGLPAADRPEDEGRVSQWRCVRTALRRFVDGQDGYRILAFHRCCQMGSAAAGAVPATGPAPRTTASDANRSKSHPRDFRLLRSRVLALPHRGLPQRDVSGGRTRPRVGGPTAD